MLLGEGVLYSDIGRPSDFCTCIDQEQQREKSLELTDLQTTQPQLAPGRDSAPPSTDETGSEYPNHSLKDTIRGNLDNVNACTLAAQTRNFGQRFLRQLRCAYSGTNHDAKFAENIHEKTTGVCVWERGARVVHRLMSRSFLFVAASFSAGQPFP